MNAKATDPMAGIPDLGDGRFQLLERIGAGGMGTVYRAIQKSVGRSVAIKVLAPQQAANASGVARFVREANVISRLAHPNIVSVIDFGRDRAGNLLLVMELLDGEPLRQTIRRSKRLPVSRAISVATQVLNALRVAHGAGIIHRDLKPENIFVSRFDGNDLVKVLDFGVAKLVSNDVGDETTAGSLVGTLRYMAPEQIAGDPPDVRVDLHAVGVVLYELLTGTLPYDSKERLQLLRAILNDPPIPLSVRAPDLPRELCDVVMRAIAKTPSDRYQSADEFRTAIAPFANLGVVAGGPVTAVDLPAIESSPDAATKAGRMTGPRPMLDPPSASGSGIRAATPAFSPLPGHDTLPGRMDLTTNAGLTSDSRRIEAPRRASSMWIYAGVVVGIVAIGSSAGLFLGRRHVEQPATNTNPAPVTGTNNGSGGVIANPPPPVTATSIVLRTNPPGASAIDTATGTVLCTTTPCAVSVLPGQPRRVSLSLGTSTMQALLEPGISPVTVDLQAPTAATGTQQTEPTSPETQPGSSDTNTHRRHTPRSGSHGNVQMFDSPPVQMFGAH